MDSQYTKPINLGNPEELNIKEKAKAKEKAKELKNQKNVGESQEDLENIEYKI